MPWSNTNMTWSILMTTSSPVLNRGRKINYAFSMRNQRCENVARLDTEGIEIRHIPNVHALLVSYYTTYEYELHRQLHEAQVTKPLSIAYEVVRGWTTI